MRTCIAFLTLLTIGNAPGSIDALRADEAQPIRLTIEPRAIESPILKYRLLPQESELKPGNAAPILLRLPWEQPFWMQEVYPTLADWAARPLNDPRWKIEEQTERLVPETFYAQMKRAAYRRNVSWEYPIGETPTPHLILLPDVQGLRTFLGHGLTARIRYQLSRGDLKKAREGILVGLSNARHLAQTPFYVTQLVAAAIDRQMLDQVEELISQPDSANLYWALSVLPGSLLELDRAADFSGDLFAQTFPAVNDFDRPRTVAEWSRMAQQLLEFLEQLGEIPRLPPLIEGEPIVEQLMRHLEPGDHERVSKLLTAARNELPEVAGITPEKATAMSTDELSIRWYAHLRMTYDQQVSALMRLPPREALPQLARLKDLTPTILDLIPDGPVSPLDSTKVYLTVWKLRRKIQALRIIEAVRHHLAVTGGQLPMSLDDIEVAIPVDPLTDLPFVWRAQRDTASLAAPLFPAEFAELAAVDDPFLVYFLKVR